ncbi:MAG TPA: hypothetical protein VK427_16825, partial [Kofleriaceae bacterium]|nr:hypothetical protein [Kofleriaceae bacterium]
MLVRSTGRAERHRPLLRMRRARHLHSSEAMLNTVKDFFSSAADVTLPFARSVGVSSTDLVKSFGAGTVSIAKDIGPKRALIGFAIVAAAVGGGILLARYLRTREDDQQDDASST